MLLFGRRIARFAHAGVCAAIDSGKRNYTEAVLWLSTKAETNSAQRAATCSRSGP